MVETAKAKRNDIVNSVFDWHLLTMLNSEWEAGFREWANGFANGRTGFTVASASARSDMMSQRLHSQRRIGWLAQVLRLSAIAIVVGIILAVLGPFGSYVTGGPVQRAGYWIAAVLLGLVLYGGAYKAVAAFVAKTSRLWWPSLIGVTLIVSVPETLATRAGAFWLWPELAQLQLPLLQWFAQTSMIGLVAMAGTSLVLHRIGSGPKSDDLVPRPTLAVSDLLSGDVLALQMEDHYVRVHRPYGSELVLMPLSRAIAVVQGEGLQTHRSWWVAGHAVVGVEGTHRAMRLHLSNGVVAPVARSAVAHIKAAGWISEGEGGSGFRARLI